MGFKEEMKKEMNNVMHDLNTGVSNEWRLAYDGHDIILKNEIKKEELWIDGELVDENIHTSLWSHLRPISKLTGELPNGKKVTATLGGLVKLVVKVKVGREVILKEKLKVELAPSWEGKEAIVPYLREKSAEGENIALIPLPDEAFSVPADEKDIEAGHRDYLGYDMPFGSFVKKLLKQLTVQVVERTDEARKATYTRILEEHVRMYGGEFLYELQESDINRDDLRDEMLWLLEHGAHREVIKFALLVLAYLQVDEDEDLLYFIGQHEEFTVFAAGGLSQEKLWRLVQQVHGWGKISVMYHLEALDERAKWWFLEQTWQDEEKRKEVALLRADKCELDHLLHTGHYSNEQFSLIATLVGDLIKPYEEGVDDYLIIDDYGKGGQMLKLFVQTVKKQQLANEYKDLLTEILQMVRTKLAWEDVEDEDVNEPGYVDAEYLIADLEMIEELVQQLIE